MSFVLLVPAILSVLVLGAHFLRFQNYALVLLALTLIPLLFVRRPWAVRAIQAALVLGTIVWLQTTFNLLHARQQMGMPYLRMVIILGSVAGFTLLSALLLQTRCMRRHYGLLTADTN